mgnify:CR=1 FL=1
MVNLTTKELIDFFEGKLREADKIDPVGDEDGLLRWWGLCKTCCERMGKRYEDRARKVDFSLHILYMGEQSDKLESRRGVARAEGFEDAKQVINGIIDELSTFGYATENRMSDVGGKREAMDNNSSIVINNTNAQLQSQSIKIDLSSYSTEVRECVEEILVELQGKKDKTKIKALLSKLTDIGIDVLTAIFLHAVGL